MNGFEFTHQEWQRVRLAPWIAATAVITSDRGGMISTPKEVAAVARHIRTARGPDGHQRLVRAIAEDLYYDPASGPLTEPEQQASWQKQLRAALDIVDAKAPGAANQDLRQWLFAIANDVAKASRDRTIRGEPISEAEQAVLDELSTILDVG